ncbi:YesL family protein [Paenibacillus koleovorans]|uniref:YesL family protein n=1 Tax=Paenibacillus koleovorans TaxID=121608 RepID=UPI000FD7BE0E|nr:DUF624 domain-containing protein [Paenibacillus koleovorans]
MEFRGIMGGFYRISEWIMRLSVINVLWVICSFPFFYLVLAGLIAISENPDVWVQSLTLLAIVSPFTLFPATAAVFTVARKWVTGDTDVSLFKTYFRGYKENYLQAMLGGIFYILLTVIVIVNYKFYLEQSNTLSLLSVLFIILLVILGASMFHFFSLMVHFHMKLFQLLKNAILITIGNPLITIMLIVSNGAVAYVSFTKFTFLIPFFMGSIMATLSFFWFNRIFDKIKTRTEKEQKKKEEQEAKAEAERLEAEGGVRKDGVERFADGDFDRDSHRSVNDSDERK